MKKCQNHWVSFASHPHFDITKLSVQFPIRGKVWPSLNCSTGKSEAPKLSRVKLRLLLSVKMFESPTDWLSSAVRATPVADGLAFFSSTFSAPNRRFMSLRKFFAGYRWPSNARAWELAITGSSCANWSGFFFRPMYVSATWHARHKYTHRKRKWKSIAYFWDCILHCLSWALHRKKRVWLGNLLLHLLLNMPNLRWKQVKRGIFFAWLPLGSGKLITSNIEI